MLTTTLEGLWVLQVLTGFEVLAPELGLRTHFPAAEPVELALAHPVAADLERAGVITGTGSVDPPVVEWLSVVARREVSLLFYSHAKGAGSPNERVLLARFAGWWSALSRSGEAVRIRGVGAVSTNESAGSVILTLIEDLCGAAEPADMRPITFAAGELLSRPGNGSERSGFSGDRNADSDQRAILALASDSQRSTHLSMVAMQSGLGSEPSRSHVEPAAVTIIDTPRGRLLAEPVHQDGADWLVVGPGSSDSIASAVLKMMYRLPAGKEWLNYRKAV